MAESAEKTIALTGKQKAFADAYLGPAKFNGTKAARLAGYKGNDATLAAVAYENLRKPQIRAYLDERLSALTMPANAVLARLTEIAESDIGDYYDKNGKLDLLAAKEQGRSHLIKKVKRKRLMREVKKEAMPTIGEAAEDEILETSVIHEETEIELYSAHEALRDLGKYHKLFVERQEITGKDGKDLIPSFTIEIVTDAANIEKDSDDEGV